MKKFEFGIYMVLVFVSGMNCAIQLSQLVVIHPGEASWWKVGFTAVLAAMWGVFGWNLARGKDS